MPSPNPVTFSKAASTNQQINSKLIYRRPSGLPEQAEDSSSIGYQKENSISCNSDDKKMIDKEIPNNTNSTAQQQQHQSNNNNNNNNNMGSGYSIRSYQQDDGSKSSFRKWVVKKFDEYKPSLVLENKASVARDHLANERTFLAWLRTSLSFVGIGVAVTQLFRLKGESSKGGNIIGIVFIILGILFLGFGLVRYFHSQYLMTTGHFPASRGSVLVGTILTILSLTACFLVIIIDN